MKLCCFSVINVKTTSQAFTFIFFQHWYQCTDATDFSMFSLAPMLPMFDVRCANRPNSTTNNIPVTYGALQVLYCIVLYCNFFLKPFSSTKNCIIITKRGILMSCLIITHARSRFLITFFTRYGQLLHKVPTPHVVRSKPYR